MQFLAGNDAAADSVVSPQLTREALNDLRDKLKAEQGLVIVFGSELRGATSSRWSISGWRRARSSSAWATTPTRVARPTWGSIPTCCPVTRRWAARPSSTRTGSTRFPRTPGLNLLQMVDAAKAGNLKALYVVGSNPIARYNIDPFALSKTFVVVQDMFLTETATIADVVLPVANAYEKSGTLHQHLRRPADAEEGRRLRRNAQRLRVHRAHRASHGIRRSQAGSLRRCGVRAPTWGRHAGRNRAKSTSTPCG